MVCFLSQHLYGNFQCTGLTTHAHIPKETLVLASGYIVVMILVYTTVATVVKIAHHENIWNVSVSDVQLGHQQTEGFFQVILNEVAQNGTSRKTQFGHRFFRTLDSMKPGERFVDWKKPVIGNTWRRAGISKHEKQSRVLSIVTYESREPVRHHRHKLGTL